MTTPDTGPWGLWHPEKGWAALPGFGPMAWLSSDDAARSIKPLEEASLAVGYTVRSFTAAAVEAERERLAQWCERYQMGTNCREKGPYAGYVAIEFHAETGGTHTGHGYAAAIRAGEGEK